MGGRGRGSWGWLGWDGQCVGVMGARWMTRR